MQKKLFPKTKLRACRALKRAKKFTIDLNLNMKVDKNVSVDQ